MHDFADELGRMGAARRDGAGRARQEGRAHGRGTGGAGCRRHRQVDPALSGVVEVFDDVIADPGKDGTNLDGPFAGLPFLMKDLGPTMKGRLQEMGSLLMRGNRATADTFLTGKIRQAGLNLIGRTTTPEFGVCSSAENPGRLRHPQSLEHRLHHLRLVGGQRRDGRGRRGADRACDRRRRLDPHSRRRQRQYRPEGVARRVLAGAAYVGSHWARLDPGLPVAFGTRHRRFRRRLPRPRARRIHAVSGRRRALHGADHSAIPQLRIALSHQWGDYRATPQIAAELERVGRFLEGLGHHVEYACPRSTIAPPSRRRPRATSAISRVVIGNMLAAHGLERPPADLIEPVNIRIWEAAGTRLCRAGADAGGVQHHLARLWRVLREVGLHPDADHGAADA